MLAIAEKEGGEGNENTITVSNWFLLCTLCVPDISDLHALSHSSLTSPRRSEGTIIIGILKMQNVDVTGTK